MGTRVKLMLVFFPLIIFTQCSSVDRSLYENAKPLLVNEIQPLPIEIAEELNLVIPARNSSDQILHPFYDPETFWDNRDAYYWYKGEFHLIKEQAVCNAAYISKEGIVAAGIYNNDGIGLPYLYQKNQFLELDTEVEKGIYRDNEPYFFWIYDMAEMDGTPYLIGFAQYTVRPGKSTGIPIPCYWEDGFLTFFMPYGWPHIKFSALDVDEADIYLLLNEGSESGYYINNRHWKLFPLLVNTSDILRHNDDLYIIGNDGSTGCYWINGKQHLLEFKTIPTGIVVKDDDVYISGVILTDDGLLPCYWKNGELHQLPGPSHTSAIGIYTDNDSIIITGTIMEEESEGSHNGLSCMWIDGELYLVSEEYTFNEKPNFADIVYDYLDYEFSDGDFIEALVLILFLLII